MPQKEDPVNAYLRKIGKVGGKARAAALSARKRRMISRKGGRAAQAGKSAEERSAAARRAARARWSRKV